MKRISFSFIDTTTSSWNRMGTWGSRDRKVVHTQHDLQKALSLQRESLLRGLYLERVVVSLNVLNVLVH